MTIFSFIFKVKRLNWTIVISEKKIHIKAYIHFRVIFHYLTIKEDENCDHSCNESEASKNFRVNYEGQKPTYKLNIQMRPKVTLRKIKLAANLGK
jgi:hypothetical protein